MSEELPVEQKPIRSIGETISEWLGIKLPSVSMPQTLKNFDKAASTLVVAVGRNFEERVNVSTSKVVAKGKIDVEGLYRNAEEKRKIENRAEIVKLALEDLGSKHSSDDKGDATKEIEDDWLNLFARIAEDKSSDELKSLFGKILSGEIRSPGSFSLRTLQFLATLSKDDAQAISQFLSYVIGGQVIPRKSIGEIGPNLDTRLEMEELGLVTTHNTVGGLAWVLSIPAKVNFPIVGQSIGIIVANQSDRLININVECQFLTKVGIELMKVANPPLTDRKYLEEVSQIIFEKIRGAGFADEIVNQKTVKVVAGVISENSASGITLIPFYEAKMEGQ